MAQKRLVRDGLSYVDNNVFYIWTVCFTYTAQRFSEHQRDVYHLEFLLSPPVYTELFPVIQIRLQQLLGHCQGCCSFPSQATFSAFIYHDITSGWTSLPLYKPRHDPQPQQCGEPHNTADSQRMKCQQSGGLIPLTMSHSLFCHAGLSKSGRGFTTLYITTSCLFFDPRFTVL